MAKSRSLKAGLTRALDATSSVVYLVSVDRNILYANPACCKWIGVDEEKIKTAKCVYSSAKLEDELQNRLRGLCPPPESFSGESRHGRVFRLIEHDSYAWRSAEFTPLVGGRGEVQAVLVTTHSSDQPAASVHEGTLAHDQLHSVLADVRAQYNQKYAIGRLIGTGPSAARIRRQVNAATISDADLLIVGPPGCGREHLARTIHAGRTSAENDLLTPVHCAIADQYMIQDCVKGNDSEKGIRLLLIDVDRLSSPAQIELFGFTQLPNFPLNTISTASQSLFEMAARDQFHAALAAHLSTITIELVGLADRPSDIPLLAQAFLERENEHRDRQLSRFDDEAMQLFVQYQWPENIDELERVVAAAVEAAVEADDGHLVGKRHLPTEFRHAVSAQQIGKPNAVEIDLDEYLARIELKLIKRAVAQTKGNKTRAAKLLGISRARLIRRLDQLGFEPGATVQRNESGENYVDSSAFEEAD